MQTDPIVEEIHRIRERMWERCGRDLTRLVQHMNDLAEQHEAEKRAHATRVLRGRARGPKPSE